eukprot:2995391-Rhodomonas_salina.2
MSGTDLAQPGIPLAARYAMSGTDIGHFGTHSSTEPTPYGATRLLPIKFLKDQHAYYDMEYCIG